MNRSIESRLEEILARFEGAAARCATPAELQRTRGELLQAIGLTARPAEAVAMIDGAVVPRALWEQFAARILALHEELDARAAELGTGARAALEARRTGTLRFWYPAHFEDPDSEERFEDPALLAGCDGVGDETDLAGRIQFAGSPVLALPIRAVVRHQVATGGLFVAIEIPLERRPTAADVGAIAGRIEQALFSGWGLNPGFAFADELSELAFHFETRPARHDLA